MRDLKENFKSSGYSLEDLYFHRLNATLIEQIREKYKDQKVISLTDVRKEMETQKKEMTAPSGQAPPGRKSAA